MKSITALKVKKSKIFELFTIKKILMIPFGSIGLKSIMWTLKLWSIRKGKNLKVRVILIKSRNLIKDTADLLQRQSKNCYCLNANFNQLDKLATSTWRNQPKGEVANRQCKKNNKKDGVSQLIWVNTNTTKKLQDRTSVRPVLAELLHIKIITIIDGPGTSTHKYTNQLRCQMQCIDL